MTETITAQCSECEGAGLKIGWAEKDGAAVVCRQCHGAGSRQITYIPFAGRQNNPQAIRVWKINPGYRISPEHTDGGIPVADWLQNPDLVHQPEAAMQVHICPAMWYREQEQPFDDCHKVLTYDDCPWWSQKAQCWTAYLQQQQTGQPQQNAAN